MSAATVARAVVSADTTSHQISRHIYGHFAEHLGRCVYEGLYVGEDSPIPNVRGFRKDVVAALRQLSIPNLRWPGGCFADTYHWMDGIGPRESRPSIVNVHWGGTTENNHCGTHEFMDLCGQLGCEPYVCGNVGSGTVREMAEWLEYLTMPGESPMARLRRKNGRQDPWPLTYWAVGNENWGCGGNMRAEYYADLYRQYASYCRHFGSGAGGGGGGGGGRLYKIACGFGDDWNEVLMREAGRFMNGLSVHYYTIPHTWERKGSATDFSDEEYYLTLRKAVEIEGFIRRTSAIMDRYDPEKKVGMIMDEWGTWFDVEPGTNPGFLYQQNTMRDALVAGLTFHVFHAHADRVHMANIAQTVNVLQAMVLTEGAKMVLTPTYHVFEMYKVHQDAMWLPTHVESSPCGEGEEARKVRRISVSASRKAGGNIHVSLCNASLTDTAEVEVELRGTDTMPKAGRILTAGSVRAMNTFEKPDVVKPAVMDPVLHKKGGFVVKLPPCSVAVLECA